MSYRKKAPAAAALSTAQLLTKLCNVRAGAYPFQAHNSIALLRFLQENHTSVYDAFAAKASVQHFYPKWSVDADNVKDGAVPVKLPLAQRYIDDAITVDDFDPREFYHASALHTPPAVQPQSTTYFPRCALSGLFFSREEVVDNLQAAANDMGFKSPFWLRPNHPALESGFLKLKGGSEAICITLTDNVISIADLEPIDPALLHHSAQKTSQAETPKGRNALTGFISANPYFQNLPNDGLWISQDQMLVNKLQIKKTNIGKKDLFMLVETEQWELFNADQLTVPGRLGLRQCLPAASASGVFNAV